METIKQEHYEAEGKYADMIFNFLEIPWWHPIKKIRAFLEAENFRDIHMECCDWANEED